MLKKSNSFWHKRYPFRNDEEFFKESIPVCFIPLYVGFLSRCDNFHFAAIIKTNLLKSQKNEKGKNNSRNKLGISLPDTDNHFIPGFEQFLRFSFKATIHEAES